MDTSVLIVGGGLSGLGLARLCQQRGIDYRLIEARARFGGRIRTKPISAKIETSDFDLGPAWFWDGQPRMAQLIKSLQLDLFLQYATGDMVSEDARGQVYRGGGYAPMLGSYRLKGGFGRLIEKLADELSNDRIFLGCTARKMTFENMGILTEIAGLDGNTRSILSRKTVLALPPRLAGENISFNPDIGQRALEAMRQIPTWMAGHAKILAVYERPFWRDAGLSGDAMSQCGPMTEIHDASPQNGGPYALFGFVGYPAAARLQHKEILLQKARQQLGRLFGEAGANPANLMMQDWAFEPHTAMALDHENPGHHPEYGLTPPLKSLFDGNLILASSETATQFGGYLEGALEAAETVFKTIRHDIPVPV